MSIFSLESESGQDLTFPPLIDDSKQMFIIACFVSANLLKSRLLPEMITWDFSLKEKFTSLLICMTMSIRKIL